MNKQEFIQAAALRLISARPNTPMGDIADLANALAVYIFKDEPEAPADPAKTVSDPNTDSIEILLDEVRKVEALFVKESKHRTQCSGLEIRIANALHAADVDTVGDMLKHGRRWLLKQRTIGPMSVKCIDNALKNLYNIENW